MNPNPEQQTCVASYNIKSLKVISTNFQSVVNKVPLLLEAINKLNPDIILGFESWLPVDNSSSKIFPSNYNVFQKNRIDRTGGGVFIACRNSITCEELKYIDNCEIVVCKVTLKSNKHLICSFYRPPDNIPLMLLNYATYFKIYLMLTKFTDMDCRGPQLTLY